ncbi:MAG: pyruvate dehydrogenase (acetyl-transferring) E1 component subunit alpha [Acidobacteriota bacterium]
MSDAVLTCLNEEGVVPAGVAAPELSDEELLHLYRLMLFNRRFDERMIRLQRQGRIGFFVGSTGEEAAIIGSAYALEPQDWIVPCYREAGAAFLRGLTLREFLCQVLGNREDPIKGRQMPCHWASARLHLTSVSSPVGSQIPHAVGIAMAAKLRGLDEIALTYFGDGATSTGDFHVSCNFAGVFQAPVIFFCRNNQYAISVPLSRQTASATIAVKAQAYGIEGVRVDGNDVLAVYAATKKAADRARSGDGATLIEALTYRQGAHTTSDDPRAYRSDEEVEVWRRKDPIVRLRAFLERQGLWDENKEAALEKELEEEFQAVLSEVESLEPPAPETLFEDVYASLPWHLEEQRDALREALLIDAGANPGK